MATPPTTAPMMMAVLVEEDEEDVSGVEEEVELPGAVMPPEEDVGSEISAAPPAPAPAAAAAAGTRMTVAVQEPITSCENKHRA